MHGFTHYKWDDLWNDNKEGMIPLHYLLVIVIKVALKGSPVQMSDVKIIEL